MKRIILFIVIGLLIAASLFSIFYFHRNKNKDKKIIDNKVARNVPVVIKESDFNSADIISVEVDKTELAKNIGLKKVELSNNDNLVKKFKDEKKIVKNDIPNFVQVSDKDIVSDAIIKDQCVLNIVYKKSDLSVCDFVKNECRDLECDRYDCENYKNNWFKVSYYGLFAGSGDRELISKKEGEVIIGNLECGDKSKEDYNNQLFIDLVKD